MVSHVTRTPVSWADEHTLGPLFMFVGPPVEVLTTRSKKKQLVLVREKSHS